jgi:hypothetical protein
VNTTLIVRRSDGRVMCADDTERQDPAIVGPFPPGEYAVWVGTSRRGDAGRFELGLTQLESVRPSTLPTVEHFGIRRSFRPPLKVLRGAAGGPRDASRVALSARVASGTCAGWIPELPGHIVTVQEQFTFRMVVSSRAPTTLFVESESGEVICGRPDRDGNSAIRRSWSPGTYRIRVGSRDRGANPRYVLGLTEDIPGNPSRLPPP